MLSNALLAIFAMLGSFSRAALPGLVPQTYLAPLAGARQIAHARIIHRPWETRSRYVTIFWLII